MTSLPEINIAGLRIGYEHPPVVIAEIGINHRGSLDIAKAMVDAAVNAGAEIIKHQTHIVADEMSAHARETIPGNADKSIYDIMAECALNEAQEKALMEHVQQKGAIFISTPFSRAAVDRLEDFDVPAFKIGSGECNNYPLLEYIADIGKPVILSTGMNNLDAVTRSVEIFESRDVPLALLHTTNLYPTPPELVRLGAMTDLMQSFPDAVVGLSDHTTDNLACFGAVALGASILERHFTDSMDREGPDIVCSMDPAALTELVRGSRILALERGGNKSDLLEEEQVTRDFAYASVVAIKDIEVGDVLSMENLWVKRPGTGEIHAEHFNGILGKRASQRVESDQHLAWADVE